LFVFVFLETQTIVGWKQQVRLFVGVLCFDYKNAPFWFRMMTSLLSFALINFYFCFLAFNFHDGSNEHLGTINVHGGDDAVCAFWHDLGSETPLYASHADFLRRVADYHSAHW
jgi:hypothetical protein